MRDQLESVPAPEAIRRDDTAERSWARARTPGNDTDEESDAGPDRDESRVPGDDELDEEGSALGGEEEEEEEEADEGADLEEDGG